MSAEKAVKVKKRTCFNPISHLINLWTRNCSYTERRAVTKKCPVCDEEIPVRLLERHADLEAERVDEIVRAIGSTEVLGIAEPDDGCVFSLPSPFCPHLDFNPFTDSRHVPVNQP